MEIKHQSKETKGAFEAFIDDKKAGAITYSKAGTDTIIIDHTEVNPDFRGQDVGKKLVQASVDFARERHLKIIPLCPFAKRVFEKQIDIQDVLK